MYIYIYVFQGSKGILKIDLGVYSALIISLKSLVVI